MPKNDTWPGDVAMESLSSRDSAGSCDSVMSVNSTCSEESMEHLSAEERACLMYLEETIEALEVQEDSGLSNDEPDPSVPAGPAAVPAAEHISSLKPESGRTERHVVNHISEPQNPADGGDKPQITVNDEVGPHQPTVAPEVDLALIPPPSDFMDEPDSPAQPEKVDLPPPLEISTKKPGGTVDLEQLRQRASLKRTSLSSSPVSPESQNKPPPDLSLNLSQLAPTSGPLMGPPPEAAEPRSPPVVAPKPKKLPPNIILKSQKVLPGSEVSPGHSGPVSSDRVLLDPQKVRMEALRKLGLLKSEDADSGPSLSPKHSPQTRRSWPVPSEGSPVPSHTPPLTPSSAHVTSPTHAFAPSQSPVALSPLVTAPPVQVPSGILPAPAAFSDPVKPLLFKDSPSPVRDVSGTDVNAPVNAPSPTPPAMTKQLTPPKVTGAKSATLERSGLGLSTYMTGQDSSGAAQGLHGNENPSQLRNSRPRPASLGSGKEFSNAQGGGLHVRRASSKEPHNASQHPGDSQKTPRSQGISVLICPRAENGEDRRKALKKLGLLRD